MDPLSIATGLVTFYTTVLHIKAFTDALRDAPEIIATVEQECSQTLRTLCHTKSQLIWLEEIAPSNVRPRITSIREDLLENIACLLHEGAELRLEIARLSKSPRTNLDQLRTWAARPRHVPRIVEAHKKLVARRQAIERLCNVLDSENITYLLSRIPPPTTALVDSFGARTGSVFSSISSTSTTSSGTATSSESNTFSMPTTSSTRKSSSSSYSESASKLLLHAVKREDGREVENLLKGMGVNPNCRGGNTGMSPLDFAAFKGNISLMNLLLENGADVSAKDSVGRTSLHVAAEKDRDAAVQRLLSHQPGSDPNAQDDKGHTALWNCSYHAYSPNTFILLTALGPDVLDYRNADIEMPTALWAAAGKGRLSIATALLAAGADPNTPDDEGNTLLHQLSYWFNAVPLAAILLDNGADPNAKDTKGRTPLMRVARHGSLRLARVLVQHGVDAEAVDGRKVDAFHIACAYGHVLTATYLLDRGTGRDVNKAAAECDTALHAAARRGHKEVVRWLLYNGADKSLRSTQAMVGTKGPSTAAEVARAAGKGDIARLIETFEEGVELSWKVDVVGKKKRL